MKHGVRRWGLKAAVVVVALALAGFAVMASGIVPIKASSGHFAATAWLLQFGKSRSLATHTLGMDLPALGEPALILRGAGHYESGCRPCHGSPELRRPRIAAAMTPSPPYLAPLIGTRDPEELFYVVKHGIKFTGMPAWPVRHRDDEVRAVVAFLLELPRLDADAYRRLVYGDARGELDVPSLPGLSARASRAVATCRRCHGVDGLGRGHAAFPKLAGQRREYLVLALRAFAEDRRQSGIMGPIAASLASDELRELAGYYASLGAGVGAESARTASARATAPGRTAAGEAIAMRGIPSRGVPSCVDCHGPGSAPRNHAYPNLAGQYADYLVLQLELFKSERRGGSAFAHLMEHVASRLSAEQMRDVAAYYASLAPEREPAER